MKQKKIKANKKKPQLSIVIPVHNEEKNITHTLRSITKNITVSSEIIIVYDSDSDTTLPVAKKLKRSFKNLVLQKNTIARGPSGAIRTGIKHAKATRILVTMADLSDDLTQVDKLAKLVPTEYDIVCPSRYCKGGEQQLDAPIKIALPRLAGFLLHAFTGIPTNDPTNSFKMYSSKFLSSIRLTSTVSFSVTLEIMAKAHILDKKIFEIPTVWKDRQHGKTNFKLVDSLISYMPWFCLALTKNRIFRIPTKFMKKIYSKRAKTSVF